MSTPVGGTISGPKTSLPAHELGHTFGLSVDPTIKSWPCSLAGDLGVIACGMVGGFDEYNSDINPDGVPTWGYWVPQGPMPPSMGNITGEQCNTFCMMGSTPINAHDNWLLGGRWVDAADYEQLITRLQRGCGVGFQPSIYLSGAIDGSDNAYLGWTFQRNGISKAPDFPSQREEVRTPYGFIFLDNGGKRVGEAELPLSWTHPDYKPQLRVTVFGGFAAFPSKTRKIQLWNRINNRLLAERAITPNRPSLGTPTAIISRSGEDTYVDIRWTATDADQDSLTHFVQMASSDSTVFWPVAHALTTPQYRLQLTPDVPRGTYVVRVLSSDGVNVESRDVTFTF